MSIVTQTPRLIIREFIPEELEIYLTHFNDDVSLHIPKRSRDERRAIFNTALKQYQITKVTGIWGIFDNNTGDFIGSCLLRPFNDEANKLEVGYSLEKKCWGLGIGTEMTLAIVKHGFEDHNITEIVARTTHENIASQRVLEKSGFKHEENLIFNNEGLSFFKLAR
jgi:ribosomal-protein-alanine N-acetyltransferase